MSRERRLILLDLVLGVLTVGTSLAIAVTLWLGRPTAGPEAGAVVPTVPDLNGASEAVTSRIGPDGTIRVTHWIRSDTLIRSVTIAAPPGGSTARNLRVIAERAVVETYPVLTASTTTVPLVVPARSLDLSYDLVGAVDRTGSVPGRALAPTTFLDVDYPGASGPVRVTLEGQRVLTAACAARPGRPATRPCGRPLSKGWQVTLRGEHLDDSVTAQLDLVDSPG